MCRNRTIWFSSEATVSEIQKQRIGLHYEVRDMGLRGTNEHEAGVISSGT